MKKLLISLTAFIASAILSFGGPLDGVWINTDAATESIPKVEISGTQFVLWFKASIVSKTGPIKLTLLGDSMDDEAPDKYGYASSDDKFADRTYIVKRVGEQLVVEDLSIFKDGSKRANYQLTLTFNKQPAAEPADKPAVKDQSTILNADESAQPPTPQPDQQQADASAKSNKRPYRGVLFEYKIVTVTVRTMGNNVDTTKLNNLGDEGWELVAVMHASERHPSEDVYYLKRQKINQRPVLPPTE